MTMMRQAFFSVVLLFSLSDAFSPRLICSVHRRNYWISTPCDPAKFNNVPSSSQSRLMASINLVATPNTQQALAGLFISSIVAMKSDRILPDSGIIAALALSALLSNSGIAPTVHPLYNLCWSLFLPSSLALLLLSIPNADPLVNGERDKAWKTVKRMASPFALACTGSIVGGIAAFAICHRFLHHWLSPQQSLQAVSCLTASFIGGSVNFFATAAAIPGMSSSLLSSMATADLVVMALYFALLSVIWQSPTFQHWFGRNNTMSSVSPEDIPAAESVVVPRLQRIPAALGVSSIAILLVQGATWIDSYLSRWIPGTTCAVLAIVAPTLGRFVPYSLKQTANWLSSWAFLLFFSAIGMSADVSAAIRSGPACVGVSLIALSVHIFVTILGSRLVRHCFLPDLQLEDVLIASNAAIGGPATAAAFCSRLSPKDRREMTIAATVWGVVGYAIGTTIGITMYRIFKGFV